MSRLLAGLLLVVLGALPAGAQRDKPAISEGLGAVRVPKDTAPPAPTVTPPPVPEASATGDTQFEKTYITIGVDVSVIRASPYIRDIIRFFKAWGQGDDATLAATSTGETTVSLFGGEAVPFRQVKPILPFGKIFVTERSQGAVAGLEVRSTFWRINGKIRHGVAQVKVVKAGEGYKVTTIVVK